MARLRPGDVAPDVWLRRPSSGPLRAVELWRDRPVVIAFLRHFGCPFSTAWLARLRLEQARLLEARADVALVSMGSPAAVGRWQRERDLPFACFADPERIAYRAFGLAIGGPVAWIGPRVVARGLALHRRGIGAGLPHPGQDVRQLGGSFVVARGGRIRLAHYARDATDTTDVDALLGTLGVG